MLCTVISLWCPEFSFIIEATDRNRKPKRKKKGHLFRLMAFLPVGITSPTSREPEYTNTRGSAYWPFTLNTARNHWSKSSHDTNHLHLLNPSQHLLCWPAHTVTSQCSFMHFSTCVCVYVCEWMSECMNVSDPDINSVGTKLSSLPRTDVKTALGSARTRCEIIWGLLSR